MFSSKQVFKKEKLNIIDDLKAGELYNPIRLMMSEPIEQMFSHAEYCPLQGCISQMYHH